MDKTKIQNLIEELIEKTGVTLKNVSIEEESPKSTWFSIEVEEPHLFISKEGEGLHALNHLIHRIIETKDPSPRSPLERSKAGEGSILIDINGFQKKHVDNVRAVAHMMSERARYFKSNIEVDPMSAFERRIVHEFLAEAPDLETESTGTGHTRRVIIKYTGSSL
jgi:spoIIIJ-associated protein